LLLPFADAATLPPAFAADYCRFRHFRHFTLLIFSCQLSLRQRHLIFSMLFHRLLPPTLTPPGADMRRACVKEARKEPAARCAAAMAQKLRCWRYAERRCRQQRRAYAALRPRAAPRVPAARCHVSGVAAKIRSRHAHRAADAPVTAATPCPLRAARICRRLCHIISAYGVAIAAML